MLSTGRIILWGLKRINWTNIAMGAATATVGGAIARPVLVSVVKAGLGATALASDVWDQARTETSKIREEAQSARAADAQSADLHTEVQQLRDELASVKAQLASSSKPAKS